MSSEKKGTIFIPALNTKEATVSIRGITPIIFHKFSVKAKRQIWDRQTKKAKQGRTERDPIVETMEGCYYNDQNQIAFTANAVKQALVGAVRMTEGVTMTLLRGAVFVLGDKDDMIPVLYKGKPLTWSKQGDIVEYEDPKPENMWGFDPQYPNGLQIREDMVRVGMGSADIRFRAQVRDWELRLLLKWNDSVLSIEQIMNLLQIAGMSSGLGEWRPEKNGNFGMFEIET